MPDCQGTACDRTATWHMLIRAEVRKAFGAPEAQDTVVERLYCDDCGERALHRENSEVIGSWGVIEKTVGQQSAGGDD